MKRMTERLLTVEDLLQMQDKNTELWDGVLVVHDPSGGWHGVVESRVARRIDEKSDDGWSLGASAGFIVAQNPDRVLAPDAAYMAKDRLPKPPRSGFINGAPNLAVEIRSPTDSWVSVVEKGGIWIAHGVELVWCIDTDPIRVAALRPGQAPTLHGLGGVLDARPVLDLQLPVDALFEGLV